MEHRAQGIGLREKAGKLARGEAQGLKLKGSPSAVGGALRLRLEVGGRKGITFFSPQSTNQRINQSTRPD